MEEKVERISKIMGIMLVSVALGIDLFEMLLEWLGVGILGLSTLLSVCASLAFWIWFKMLDVPFIASPKKFFILATTCLLEIIPGLDAIGGFFWTAGTILIVLMVRAEDKGGMIGKLSGATMTLMKRRYDTYKSTFNNPQKLEELKRGLGKNVFAISKEELAAEAMGKTKEYQENKAKNMEKLQPNTLNLKNRPTQTIVQNTKREPSNNIKEWLEVTEKLNVLQTRKLAEKAGVDISDIIEGDKYTNIKKAA